MDALKFPLELGRCSHVMIVALVQSAANEGVGDRSSGFNGDPSEGLASMRRVLKHEDEMALTCWVIESDESSMKPRLRAWVVGVGADPRVAGHQEFSHAGRLEPKMMISVFSEFSLRWLASIQLAMA
ncbi:hypothetical protein NDU88_005940 [Pleurodeles waltl]|uniref:Uncharacterized protein n=1 Tax=Pleurodeles waltl TaxID=8319 RepID=A0AAV7LQH8_PLEWA|nr:hypothetical protein NDU88_005940 [Pleurodeles waltl]